MLQKYYINNIYKNINIYMHNISSKGSEVIAQD